MNQIRESLQQGDLRDMVKKTFGVDQFKSKIGKDEDIIVLNFTVDEEDPAKDLENFIEMGYSFVLDADVTPGETDDGTYQVFVEIERGRHAPEQILEIVNGIQNATNLDDMRFRYFKNFKSQAATAENLEALIPLDKNSYNISTERNQLNNFQEFFSRSYADNISLLDESIIFKNRNNEAIKFEVVTSGPKKEVYDAVPGPLMLEHSHIAEILFLSKVIGNYNITKINDTFIFENSGWAVALKRKL
jgi:hypothetical protein